MNKYTLACVFTLFTSTVSASPYFRPNPLFLGSAPITVAGAAIDPKTPKNSEGVVLLPLFTHSPKDGCAFPSISCVDWTPVAIGAALNAGKVTFDVAPLTNLLPWMQKGLLSLTPESWTGVTQVLTPTQSGPITFSAGPCWEYRQLSNKGYLMVVTALALNW